MKKKGEVQVLDLAANPVPHLTAEVLGAGYKPAESWTASEKAGVEKRLALVDQIVGAKTVTIVTGMMNWNIPSSLKAYIDNIIIPGTLDAYHARKLVGKKITLFAAYGGGQYEEGGAKYVACIFWRCEIFSCALTSQLIRFSF